MRALIQRVKKSNLYIAGELYSNIGPGLVVFLGIEAEDGVEDQNFLIRKITQMRLFDDEKGVMNESVNDLKFDIMVVSQFTLHASTKKGNRPSYIKAAKPDFSLPMYEQFTLELSKHCDGNVATGVFGADMQVELINDGPVTIWLDSKNKE